MTDAETKPEPLLVEATVHLPGGHSPGRRYWVDPRAEYIRDCLNAGYLVPVAAERVKHWLERHDDALAMLSETDG